MENVKKMVSVIVPTYSNSGTLSRAIDSVINQDYSNIEVIVVDDNNPKSIARYTTEKVMNGYSDRNNVVYIKHDCNLNGAAARNTGLKYARGEYIAFLDDDDLFLDSKISKQVNYLNKHLEFEAVYCYAMIDWKVIKCKPYIGDNSIPLLLLKTRMYTPTLMFRKSSIEAIGGFNEKFNRHQDYEILLRFFSVGFKIGCVKEALVNIDTRCGNNHLDGEHLEQLKKYFINSFSIYIQILNKRNRGIRHKIIAAQYTSVFVSYLKDKRYYKAIYIFFKYIIVSPTVFLNYIFLFMKSYFLRHV